MWRNWRTNILRNHIEILQYRQRLMDDGGWAPFRFDMTGYAPTPCAAGIRPIQGARIDAFAQILVSTFFHDHDQTCLGTIPARTMELLSAHGNTGGDMAGMPTDLFRGIPYPSPYFQHHSGDFSCITKPTEIRPAHAPEALGPSCGTFIGHPIGQATVLVSSTSNLGGQRHNHHRG